MSSTATPVVDNLVRYWTKAKLKTPKYHENDRFALLAKLGRYEKEYDIGSKGLPEAGVFGEHLKELVTGVSREYIALVGYTPEEAVIAAQESRNAILASLSTRVDVLLPLYWYWAAPVFFLNNDTEDVQMPGQCPFRIWIDGQELNLEARCRACPNSVGRLTTLCQPFRATCSNLPEPFIPALNNTENSWQIGYRCFDKSVSADAVTRLREWLDTKSMCMQLSGTYRELKQACRYKAFEKVTIGNLATTNEQLNRLEDDKQDRSGLSKTAAKTKRHRKYVCEGCLYNRYAYCSSAGGRSCHGPYYESEFKPWIEKAEPWMVHAMTLSEKVVDARKVVIKWSNIKSTCRLTGLPLQESSSSYLLKGCGDPTRGVGVIKDALRREWSTVPYTWACKQLGVKPVTEWGQIKELKNAKVDVDLIKALAASLYANKGYSTRGSSWGGGWYTAFEVDIMHDPLHIRYGSSSGISDSRTFKSFQDLYKLSHFDNSDTDCHSPRYEENAFAKDLIHKHGVNVTAPVIIGVLRRLNAGKIPSYDVGAVKQELKNMPWTMEAMK